MLTLPKYLRLELKKPLGQLYKSIDIIEEKLHQQLSEDKLIISIGDATTKNLIKLNIQPQICIVDNKIEREPVEHKLTHTDNLVHVNNPAGCITDELVKICIDSINTATSNNPVIIEVKGEEDLAVLPCILNAPKDTFILYGQPKEGVVLVCVNEAFNKAKHFYKQLNKE